MIPLFPSQDLPFMAGDYSLAYNGSLNIVKAVVS